MQPVAEDSAPALLAVDIVEGSDSATTWPAPSASRPMGTPTICGVDIEIGTICRTSTRAGILFAKENARFGAHDLAAV